MKQLLFSAFIAIGFVGTASAADIAAVRIHADWCPNCKRLDPKLETARKELGDTVSVRYVRLDYTKKNKEALWSAADEAGVLAPLQEYVGNNVKTGLLILIDEDRHTVVGKATSDFTEEELKGAIRAAANR